MPKNSRISLAFGVLRRDSCDAQIEDKKVALQESGKRILTDFGLLPLRAA